MVQTTVRFRLPAPRKNNVQATQEQIDKVAKNIFLCLLTQEEYFKQRYEQYKNDNRLEEFVKILNDALDALWNGIEDEDEMEKEKYRTLAKFALKAADYEVTITNQMHLDLLV